MLDGLCVFVCVCTHILSYYKLCFIIKNEDHHSSLLQLRQRQYTTFKFCYPDARTQECHGTEDHKKNLQCCNFRPKTLYMVHTS